ncbi:MAG: hypothetical protein JNK33_06525, partial [Candidatus Doudnabacteria bacterium]|nr:hypothetical protein [Candidatus Doudnabacteria bacterium]
LSALVIGVKIGWLVVGAFVEANPNRLGRVKALVSCGGKNGKNRVDKTETGKIHKNKLKTFAKVPKCFYPPFARFSMLA